MKKWNGEDRIIRLTQEEIEVFKNIDSLRWRVARFLKGLDLDRFKFKMGLLEKYGASREKGYRVYHGEGVIRRAI